MSALNSFTLFPLLSLEIRLMIWEFTLLPQIFYLAPKAYNWTGDTLAVPWSLVSPSRTEGSPTRNPDEVVSARFLISGVFSHVALQISQESRYLVFSRGYREWKMQNSQGHIRNVFWNPVVDVILFPPVPPICESPQELEVHYSKWVKLFNLQYPEETRIANNIAMYTSMAVRSRPWGGRWQWLNDLAKFQSLRELVIVVDKEAEKSFVKYLIERNKSQKSDRIGPWKIPQEIEEWFEKGKLHWPYILRIPVVRVVESAERVLDGQSLQICLHCNPCEYLGMG